MLDIDPTTLRRNYRDDLDTGHSDSRSTVMKEWVVALLAALLAANYLLVIVAVVSTVSVIIVFIRLLGMLN